MQHRLAYLVNEIRIYSTLVHLGQNQVSRRLDIVFNQSTASMIRRHVRYMRALSALQIIYDSGIEMRVSIPKTGVH